MKRAFVQAGGEDVLSDVLRQVGPVGLGMYLKEGRGFRVRPAGQEDQEARRDGACCRFEGTDLVASVTIESRASRLVSVRGMI